MVDGPVARRFHQQSKKGARLDSLADIIFLLVCSLKIIPVLDLKVCLWIWVIGIALIKMGNVVISFCKQKRIVMLHTFTNKLTGLLLFLLPFGMVVFEKITAAIIMICLIATFAAIQESYYLYIKKTDLEEKKMDFRFAERNDTELILSFIRELAEYEQMANEVVATPELLEEWIFDKKKAEVIFVMENRKEVGFALFFHNFSTFLGRAGIYLEDLFVKPEYRGRGYGKALICRLAKIAVERGCGRLEWWCLDWNQPSIDFYLSLGAEAMDEWTVYRVTGDRLSNLAGE